MDAQQRTCATLPPATACALPPPPRLLPPEAPLALLLHTVAAAGALITLSRTAGATLEGRRVGPALGAARKQAQLAMCL